VDRCAVFVDAGYVYAEGGRLCCGSRSRADLVLDAGAVVNRLVQLARTKTTLPVLRTYWYDAAKDGIRTKEQTDIAALDNVKVRLGRLNGRGQQKGVDALIYRDLMTLAQQRSISDAVLVSGDEDLREGVRAAQDMGVRVVLFGIESVGGHNQSQELVLEADEVSVLSKSLLQPMFTRRQVTVPPTEGSLDPAAIAVEFARLWLDRTTDAELTELWAARPRIPQPLDLELLLFVESRLGLDLRVRDAIKREIRASFWGTVGSRVGGISS
jgi:uncharacterized LabA/DUF88 family protein